jgi:hypothetical protein
MRDVAGWRVQKKTIKVRVLEGEKLVVPWKNIG